VKPWVLLPKISSPGRGDRKSVVEILFRPSGALPIYCHNPTVFTVGYYRSLLRSLKWILNATL
jgi:hypothetical protein